MPPPTVTVCIPSYNGAPHIAACIDSVLAQRYTDFELIVTDDASTDATCAIVERYRDPRVRLIRGERNLGMGGNWNRSLRVARGRYVKLLPDDDLLHPDCLLRQVEVLEHDTDARIALVFSARTIIDSDGRPHFRRGFRGLPPGRIAGAELIRRAARSGANPIGEPGAVLFRRHVAEAAGGFDGSMPYVIDLDYWFRLLQHGDGWYLPEALASFRVSATSYSVAHRTRQIEQYAHLLDRVATLPGRPAGAWDLRMGRANARLSAWLRALFYRYAIR